MGDWDRHEDQWRWKPNKKINNEIEYNPVPRDRDKVYYTTTGLLPWILSRQWLKANLQQFDNDIRNIGEYNFNNRYFDRYFLNSLNEKDWKQQIKFVQEKVTDSLIKSAMSLLPDTIYKLSGEKIEDILISRRAMLEKEGLKYFRFLSRNVDVPTTGKNEKIDVQFLDNQHVGVTITKLKKDQFRNRVIYQREFDPGVTEEIRLYGMGGNDQFTVTGTAISPIKVRLIGGIDSDTFTIESNGKNRNHIYIYDNKDKGNVFPSSALARLRTSSDSTINLFNRKSFAYEHKGVLTSVFFNPDQGFLLRVGYILEKQGFRKEPYATRHILYANYATIWKSFLFTYHGDFKKVFGNYDLGVNIVSRGPHNIDNFFGVGNETVFINKNNDAVKFYQNRFDYVNGDVLLRKTVSPGFRIKGGIGGEFYTSSSASNTNKYLIQYNLTRPNEMVFSDQYFGGLVAGAEFNTRNELIMPHKGVYWNTEMRAMKQFNGLNSTYGKVFTEFSFYIPVKDSSIVIANRIAGGTTLGDAAFYQQLKLGGPVNLRGYNLNRFTGKSMVYHNLELRTKLFDFTSYIAPGTVGLIGFNDVGRVWMPGERSTKWHNGYGGGLYIIPAELVLLQALIGRSVEGAKVYFSFGVRF